MSDRSKSGLSAMPDVSSVMAGLSSKSISWNRCACGVENAGFEGFVKAGFRNDGPVYCLAMLGLKTDLEGALKDCMRSGLACAAAEAKELGCNRLDGEGGFARGKAVSQSVSQELTPRGECVTSGQRRRRKGDVLGLFC